MIESEFRSITTAWAGMWPANSICPSVMNDHGSKLPNYARTIHYRYVWGYNFDMCYLLMDFIGHHMTNTFYLCWHMICPDHSSRPAPSSARLARTNFLHKCRETSIRRPNWTNNNINLSFDVTRPWFITLCGHMCFLLHTFLSPPWSYHTFGYSGRANITLISSIVKSVSIQIIAKQLGLA